MNEQLIAGYAEYTTVEEFGTDALGDAPATVLSLISLATASAVSGASVSETVQHGC